MIRLRKSTPNDSTVATSSLISRRLSSGLKLRNKLLKESTNNRGISGIIIWLLLFISLFFILASVIFKSHHDSKSTSSHGVDISVNKWDKNDPSSNYIRRSNSKKSGLDKHEDIRSKAMDLDGETRVSISAASSTDQIVEVLLKLAQMSPSDLRAIFDSDEDTTNHKNDPFYLNSLERGLCPWMNMNINDQNRFKDQKNTIEIKWLPRKTLSQPSEWFKNRDQQNHHNNDIPPVAIYYEHLSKAGGTSFCKLAQSNMPRIEVPRYYCMPSAPDNPDARVGSWTKAQLVEYFKTKEHRIVSNEWEPFNTNFLSLQPTSEIEVRNLSSSKQRDITLLFITSIRHPINRLLSAYKFWGILHNGQKVHPTLAQFIERNGRRANRWKIMSPDFAGNVARFNFATWKFSGGTLPVTQVQMDAEKILSEESLRDGGASKFYSLDEKSDYSWKESFEQAIRVLAKFDLVIPMELLSTHPSPVIDILGWKDFDKSHIVPSGKVLNNDASSQLSNEQNEALWNGNTLDMIIYYWTRAVYLTRLHCSSILIS